MDAISTGTLQSSDQQSSSSNTENNELGIAPEVEEEDFTKDNAASPTDLECHIQAERITKILNEALYKIKIAIALPELIEKLKSLTNILNPHDLGDITFIFEQYNNPLFSPSLLNITALEDVKAGDLSLKNRLNPELGHLINILNSYPQLSSDVEDIIQKMKKDYFLMSEMGNPTPIPILEYLLSYERFRDQMIKQMATTAAEELIIKLNLRKLENSNAELLHTIQDYKNTICKEQEEFEKMMKSRKEEIVNLQQELAVLNEEATAKLKKKVLDSDRAMVMMTRAHSVRSQILKEEEMENSQNYKQILYNHLIDEKNQRARRFKVETQLLSWLQKYDTEMTDKQEEKDELEKKYEEELKKCEHLEKKLADQDLEYIPLMKERDDEYHEEMTAKFTAFQLEHAARVIQKYWRTVLNNRVEKKKLKKMVKKMKQEQDLAEKREEARQKAEAAAEKKGNKP